MLVSLPRKGRKMKSTFAVDVIGGLPAAICSRITETKVFSDNSLDSKAKNESNRHDSNPGIITFEDRWMAETAASLVDFAIRAQMQGFKIDRKVALHSIRRALELVTE
jgi:hypothetical protein